jgi:hypothetical protein
MPPKEERNDGVRVGSTVVVPDGGWLPRRCIKCNAPASGDPIRYTFVESNVIGPHGIESAIVHFATRRKAQVYISLCEPHRNLRFWMRWSCPVFVLAAIGVGIYANLAYPKPPNVLVWFVVVLVFAGVFPLGMYQQHYLKGRVRQGRVWISGADTDFVNSLPEQKLPQ